MGNTTEDRVFFRAEIERLTDRLHATARRLTGNSADADDLVAEAVVKAWSRLDQLKDRKAFPKWILRILVTTFLDDCRARNAATPEVDCDEDGFSLFEQVHQPFLLWWSNPEQELVNKLLREDIEAALDGLPDGFRMVVVLVEIQGYAYAEVAEMLGVPVGTVRSRLSRARSLLQRALWRQAIETGLLVASKHKEHVGD